MQGNRRNVAGACVSHLYGSCKEGLVVPPEEFRGQVAKLRRRWALGLRFVEAREGSPGVVCGQFPGVIERSGGLQS